MRWQELVVPFDDRREAAVPGDGPATISYCVEQFISVANQAIQDRGSFSVALSGGSTPKAVYEQLALPQNRKRVDWSKAMLFWSDERCVPSTSPESNYRMAMEAGMGSLGIPREQIFRMEAEGDLELHAKAYEELIAKKLPTKAFDLMLLGVGEDGHTASLFPYTHGLHVEGRLAIANFLPHKDIWRMSLTFDCINSAHHISVYALGQNKAAMIAKIFNEEYNPDVLPAQKIGTRSHKALWIMDQGASSLLNLSKNATC
jgi:6-phosphogluconolactonase